MINVGVRTCDAETCGLDFILCEIRKARRKQQRLNERHETGSRGKRQFQPQRLRSETSPDVQNGANQHEPASGTSHGRQGHDQSARETRNCRETWVECRQQRRADQISIGAPVVDNAIATCVVEKLPFCRAQRLDFWRAVRPSNPGAVGSLCSGASTARDSERLVDLVMASSAFPESQQRLGARSCEDLLEEPNFA